MPYNFITYLLEQFSQPDQDIERLLPWNANSGWTSFTIRLPRYTKNDVIMGSDNAVKAIHYRDD
jgi:hypothetical protein